MSEPALRKCDGLPQVGTRMLAPEEVAWLHSQLATQARTYKGYRILSWTAAGTMLLCSGLLLAMRPPGFGEPSSLIGFALACLAPGMFVAGAFGALGEVLFGFRRTSQVVFALAWVTLGLTFLIEMPGRLEGALRAGIIVLGMFAGCTMMFFRVIELRAFASIAPDLRLDLTSGVVWQFAGESSSWEVGEEDDDTTETDAADEVERHTADVLPRSHVALRIDGVATKIVITMRVTGAPPDDLFQSS